MLLNLASPHIVYYSDNLPETSRLDPTEQPRLPLPQVLQRVVDFVQKQEASSIFNNLNQKVIIQFGEQSGVELSASSLFPLSRATAETFRQVSYFDLQYKVSVSGREFTLHGARNRLLNQIELQGAFNSVWFADEEFVFIQAQEEDALISLFSNETMQTFRLKLSAPLQHSSCDGQAFVLVDQNCLVVSGLLQDILAKNKPQFTHDDFSYTRLFEGIDHVGAEHKLVTAVSINESVVFIATAAGLHCLSTAGLGRIYLSGKNSLNLSAQLGFKAQVSKMQAVVLQDYVLCVCVVRRAGLLVLAAPRAQVSFRQQFRALFRSPRVWKCASLGAFVGVRVLDSALNEVDPSRSGRLEPQQSEAERRKDAFLRGIYERVFGRSLETSPCADLGAAQLEVLFFLLTEKYSQAKDKEDVAVALRKLFLLLVQAGKLQLAYAVAFQLEDIGLYLQILAETTPDNFVYQAAQQKLFKAGALCQDPGRIRGEDLLHLTLKTDQGCGPLWDLAKAERETAQQEEWILE